MSEPGRNISLGRRTDTEITLDVVRPYDFSLCLKAFRSFGSSLMEHRGALRLAARIDRTPTLIEIMESVKQRGKIIAASSPEADNKYVRSIAEWVLFAELDLTPFYLLTTADPRLAQVTRQLRGLKPMRPISLFEMAVIAITEQQISMAAAHKIRSRIIQRFGESVDSEWIFTEASVLAKATLEDLYSCGLSRQKAGYIQNLASKVAGGELDLDILKTMDDDKAREMIVSLRGFGRWSADYILVRGLSRPDCVPIEDLGIRTVVGEYLGNGQRLSSVEVALTLEDFRPYRGLLAFYLLVAHRLKLKPAI